MVVFRLCQRIGLAITVHVVFVLCSGKEIVVLKSSDDNHLRASVAVYDVRRAWRVFAYGALKQLCV